jgi:hypothetical protein
MVNLQAVSNLLRVLQIPLYEGGLWIAPREPGLAGCAILNPTAPCEFYGAAARIFFKGWLRKRLRARRTRDRQCSHVEAKQITGQAVGF